MALVLPFGAASPRVHPTAFVAENATLIGDVTLGPGASVWFGCVLRGDVAPIVIGARSNIQDLSCVHATTGVSSVVVGDDVTIGHSVILHGCRVGDRCLIGMGSILLDNVDVGEGSVVGAGSLLTPRAAFAAGQLVLGRPAKAVRAVTADEAMMGSEGAAHYVTLAKRYERDPDLQRG